MEIIIYDMHKYYRESRWAAELREGGGGGDIVCKAKVGSLPIFSEVSYSPFLSTS